jgi:glycosyltransferase involved in cell wall biosynthesis
MRNKRAVFTGMARDCAWHLPSVLQNIERLSNLYSETAVVIVENDSSDATKGILRSWLADRPNGKLIELDGLAAAEPRRTQRIATARNAAMDYIRSSPLKGWDHLVVLDLDEVNSQPISGESFEKAANFLDSDATIAGVFANQVTGYYDIFALRKRGWCSSNCWEQIGARPRWLSPALAKIVYVYARQVAIPQRARPVRVDSAFGGLAIYKISSAASFNYNGLDADNREICEHVDFNIQVSTGGGRLFIYPGLTNVAPCAHLLNPSDFGRRDLILLGLIRLWNTVFPPWQRCRGESA